MTCTRRYFVLAAIMLLLAGWSAAPALAVIKVLYPLKSVLSESTWILTATVEKVDPDRPAMVLAIQDSLKGKAPFERLAVNLAGDEEKDTPQLLKRIAPDTKLVIFVMKSEGGKLMALGFSNGTWFQMLGYPDGDTVRWAYTHCEIYLRRTFHGTTDELREHISQVLARKAKPREPDEKEPAGLGPELANDKGALPR